MRHGMTAISVIEKIEKETNYEDILVSVDGEGINIDVYYETPEPDEQEKIKTTLLKVFNVTEYTFKLYDSDQARTSFYLGGTSIVITQSKYSEIG